MDKCSTADATVKACNSIVIDRDSQISDRCQLHDVAVGENNVTSESSGSLQYFNKPPWYRGMFSVDIYNHNEIIRNCTGSLISLEETEWLKNKRSHSV